VAVQVQVVRSELLALLLLLQVGAFLHLLLQASFPPLHSRTMGCQKQQQQY
jgi:hypothetical protein